MIAIEYKNGNVTKRNLTSEEVTEMERQAAEIPPIEPTPEERIASLEVLTDDIVLFMADLIGG